MADDDANLLRPGECEVPFPVPPLERTYRIYLPLVDLAVADGSNTIAPPHSVGASLKLNARALADLDRTADAFGGVPLNALDLADDPHWSQPLLERVVVSDVPALIRAGNVEIEETTVPLALAAENVAELFTSRATVARRADGGFIKLALADDAWTPPVLLIDDLEGFLREPTVETAIGRRRGVRLSSRAVSRLVGGDPVLVGSGRRATVLMKISDGLSMPAPGSPTPSQPPPGGSQPGGATTTTTTSDAATPAGSSDPRRPPSLAVLLPLDQRWLLETYEQGRMVSSISLTPQEEVTVDVYSWDRRKTSREETTTFDSEANAESQSVDRDTRDVFGELTKSGTIGWGLNGSFSGYGLTIGGGVNNGTTVGNIARKTRQQLHEQTVKASEKVHFSRQLKIAESTETGSEERVTRRLRNSNLCHAVTYHFFELAARYDVKTAYVKDETVFVLLVDNPFARPPWDVDYVRTYEGVLRSALLDTSVAPGFDAARMLWMLAHATPVICNDAACPGDRAGSEDSAQFDQAVAAVRALGTMVNTLRTNAASFLWRGFFATLVPPVSSVIVASPVGGFPVASLRRALFVDAMEFTAPGVLADLAAMCAPLMSGTVTAAELEAFSTQFSTIDLALIDAALVPDADLQARIKAQLESRIRSAYAGIAKASVQPLLAGNRTGNPFVDGFISGLENFVLTENNAAGVIVNAIVGSLEQSPGLGATDGAGIKTAAKVVAAELTAWTAGIDRSAAAAAEARRSHQTTFNTVFPPANLLAAQERFDALVRHLRAYGDYYANVIVTDMVSRGQFPVPIEILQFSDWVALRPIAVVDGRLAYPLLLDASPTFATAQTLLDSIIAALPTDVDTDEVVLPTPGFVVEPKLSCCSACEEFVEQSRAIDLDLHRAQAEQAQHEAQRRSLLLAQTPPSLDPFDLADPTVHVRLEQPAAPPGG